MIATSAGRDAIVSMLICHGADINSSNEGGQIQARMHLGLRISFFLNSLACRIVS